MFFQRGLIIAVISLILDQLNKWYMINVINISDNPTEFGPFLNLVMVWNTGISFGMFHGSEYGSIVFSVVSTIIVIILLFWLAKTDSLFNSVSIGLIIGGAVGNIVDRIRYGAVADFFDFHIAGYHWPAFNVADVSVSIGAIMLCIGSFFCNECTDGAKQNHEKK